jgi:toxin YoeB
VRQEDRLVNWKLVYTRQAQKDAKKLAAAGLKDKAIELLKILERDSYESPPPYEKLTGDLAGACSRRISVQHRLVYQILDKQRTVKIIRLWTHYE